MWIVGWNVQSSLAGKPPTESYEEMVAKSEVPLTDETIERLRASTKAFPDDTGAWRALGEAMFNKLRETDNPPSQWYLETIDVMREILKRNAEDTFALLAMADISFNQQVFQKALEFYERYLALQPKDRDARTRYASALTFNGKFKEAEEELKSVLKEDPEDFHALAYLAITYAQQGGRDKALETGAQALRFAPSQEARERFESFLSSLKGADSKASDSSGSGLEALEGFIRSNPVAGPKFVRAELGPDKALALYFRDFPMDQMPPFVREKFVTSVKDRARESLGDTIQRIIFTDSATGAELASVNTLSAN